MPKSSAPSFVLDLPLVVQTEQSRAMNARFESGRRLFNAVLGDALKILDLMRESKIWNAAKLLPKGSSRNKAFAECNKHFKFTEYDIQSIATVHKNAAGFDGRLGAHETQKIGTRVFNTARAQSPSATPSLENLLHAQILQPSEPGRTRLDASLA